MRISDTGGGGEGSSDESVRDKTGRDWVGVTSEDDVLALW
jgi:hypothetical protein